MSCSYIYIGVKVVYIFDDVHIQRLGLYVYVYNEDLDYLTCVYIEKIPVYIGLIIRRKAVYMTA